MSDAALDNEPKHTYLTVHIFSDGCDFDQKAKLIRKIISNLGIITECDGFDYTIFKSNNEFKEVLKSILMIGKDGLGFTLAKRNEGDEDDECFIYPDSLKEQILPLHKIDFRSFPLQVRNKISC